MKRAVTRAPRKYGRCKLQLLIEEVLRVLARKDVAEVRLAKRKLRINVSLLKLVILGEFNDVMGFVDGNQYRKCLLTTLLN